MKAQRARIEGYENRDLIVLFEGDPENNQWSVITTKDAVANFKPAFAFRSDDELRDMSGILLGFIEDVELFGPVIEVEWMK